MNHNEENQSTEIDRSPLTFTDLKRWLGLLVLLISAALLAWALKSVLLLFAVVFLVALVLNPIVAFKEDASIVVWPWHCLRWASLPCLRWHSHF